MTAGSKIGRRKAGKGSATVLMPEGQPVSRGLAERLVGYSFAEATDEAGRAALSSGIPLVGVVDGEIVTVAPDGRLQGSRPRAKRSG